MHRLVGIGLDRVADKRRHVGKGAGEHAVVPLQGRGGIAIERSADRLGEACEIHRLGVQHAVAISKVVHGVLSRSANRQEVFFSTHGSDRPAVFIVFRRLHRRRLRAPARDRRPDRARFKLRAAGRRIERAFASASRKAAGPRPVRRSGPAKDGERLGRDTAGSDISRTITDCVSFARLTLSIDHRRVSSARSPVSSAMSSPARGRCSAPCRRNWCGSPPNDRPPARRTPPA